VSTVAPILQEPAPAASAVAHSDRAGRLAAAATLALGAACQLARHTLSFVGAC